jgi:hypothetical protein
VSLNLNRERRTLLDAIGHGRVYTSLGGSLMHRMNGRQNKRCERLVRELQEHGLVAEQLVDGKPQLTDAGRTAKEAGP